MADQRIQRRANKKKLLVLFMMLLDDEEYKHVKRRCWTRQWVSRREERGAYSLLEGIFPIVFTISIPQDSIFFIKVDYHSTCCYIPFWRGRNLGLLRLFILFHMFGRHFEWFSEESWKIIDAPSFVDLNFLAATCRRSVLTLPQGCLSLFCHCDYNVARIQTSLNSCDRSQFCRSANDFHMSHEAICCSNLSRRRVAAICRIVCLSLDCTSCYKNVYREENKFSHWRPCSPWRVLAFVPLQTSSPLTKIDITYSNTQVLQEE